MNLLNFIKSGADEICYIDNVATLYGTNNSKIRNLNI